MSTQEFNQIPRHLGLILDGNRRWAQSQGLPTLEGHRQGSEVFKSIALESFERGIKYVSAYVFSAENWQRTEEEVGYLMQLVVKATERYLKDFHAAGIKIVVLGRRDKLPQNVISSLEKTEAKTAKNSKGTLALCLNYGGHEEIVDAVRGIINENISAENVSLEQIMKRLYYPEIPELDLIIRTSGEHRLSNFMLFRAGYAELLFVDKYWPDFTIHDLDDALADYASRQRRFGS